MVRVKEPEHQFDKSRFEAFCLLYQLEFPTVMWANECFDPNKPDTFFEKVEK